MAYKIVEICVLDRRDIYSIEYIQNPYTHTHPYPNTVTHHQYPENKQYYMVISFGNRMFVYFLFLK